MSILSSVYDVTYVPLIELRVKYKLLEEVFRRWYLRHHVNLYQRCMVTDGTKLQLSLFFTVARCTKINLFIDHEFVMSNHKTHKS